MKKNLKVMVIGILVMMVMLLGACTEEASEDISKEKELYTVKVEKEENKSPRKSSADMFNKMVDDLNNNDE